LSGSALLLLLLLLRLDSLARLHFYAECALEHEMSLRVYDDTVKSSQLRPVSEIGDLASIRVGRSYLVFFLFTRV